MSGSQEKAPRVVLGVAGGIACYKAVDLVRLLVKDGFSVQVVMTREAAQFVTPLTFQTLSGKPVATEIFSLTEESEIGHINLADQAQVFVIAPATANVIGKIASGIADDLLTTVVMATQAPVLFAPSMNVHMFENPILQENIRKLRRVGYRFIEPAEGYLACGYEGKGRLPEAEVIVEEIRGLLKKKDLAGERLLITAGPNHEAIDPVRFITNRSSGKMGYALARAAVRRGAEVTLVSGPTSLTAPEKAMVLKVKTAADMRAAVLDRFPNSTTVVMAAAVSDYTPVEAAPKKLKKGAESMRLELKRNPDILKELGAKKDGRFLIGFAAETDDVIANAGKKLKEKNLDMIVANDVTAEGSGFEGETNIATILDRSGNVQTLPMMTKDELADRIFDYLHALKAARL